MPHTDSLVKQSQWLPLCCGCTPQLSLPGSCLGSILAGNSINFGACVSTCFPCILLPQGRISAWIEDCVGIHPGNVYPSVRCGLEGALLSALAQAHGVPFSSLLQGGQAGAPKAAAKSCLQAEAVLVNGLLECQGSIEACIAEAHNLVAQGYTALKLKAGCDPDCRQRCLSCSRESASSLSIHACKISCT